MAAEIKFIFAFSLYGNLPKYTEGAVQNAKNISENLIGWRAVFYVDPSVETETLARLTSLGATVLIRNSDWHRNGMFWRFRAFQDFQESFIEIRDTDSQISRREFAAVQEWVSSGRDFHIMRDHPSHFAPMLGGMWGAKSDGLIRNVSWENSMRYGTAHGDDQHFLKEFIYPLARKNALVHDSFFKFEFHSIRFPVERLHGEYVGQPIESECFSHASGDKLLTYVINSKLARVRLRLTSIAYILFLRLKLSPLFKHS
jgi:hypothetical protein